MSFLNKKLVTLQYAGRSKTLELLKIDATRIETDIIQNVLANRDCSDQDILKKIEFPTNTKLGPEQTIDKIETAISHMLNKPFNVFH